MSHSQEFQECLLQLFAKDYGAAAEKQVAYEAIHPRLGFQETEDHIDEAGYMLPSHPDYDANEHIIDLINQTIVNTLTHQPDEKESLQKLDGDSVRNLSTLHTIKMQILSIPDAK